MNIELTASEKNLLLAMMKKTEKIKKNNVQKIIKNDKWGTFQGYIVKVTKHDGKKICTTFLKGNTSLKNLENEVDLYVSKMERRYGVREDA